jgi:uncharacterized membrane protein YozB (DUF420 family)
MEKGLLHLHSFLRWAILILLLVAVYKSFADRQKAYTAGHKKAGMFVMICADIMLLLGLYQWFTGPWGLKSIQTNGMSAVMKDPVSRFFAMEHIIGMLIAIVLIHIGYSYAKKNVPDTVKHKRAVLLFGLDCSLFLFLFPGRSGLSVREEHGFPECNRLFFNETRKPI